MVNRRVTSFRAVLTASKLGGGPKRLSRQLLKCTAPACQSAADEDVKPFVPNIAVPRETIIDVDCFNCVNPVNSLVHIIGIDEHPPLPSALEETDFYSLNKLAKQPKFDNECTKKVTDSNTNNLFSPSKADTSNQMLDHLARPPSPVNSSSPMQILSSTEEDDDFENVKNNSKNSIESDDFNTSKVIEKINATEVPDAIDGI